MADLGQAYVQIVPKAEGISGKIENLIQPGSAEAGRKAGGTIGTNIGQTVMKTVAALGIGKMISDSISSGMDFETSMAKASTLFTGTNSQLAGLESNILRISSQTGVAAAELAEAAYSAESASVPMLNLGGMIEESAKLATAGFTDIDTALSATAKTMNAYGMMSDDATQTQKNMEKVQRILIQTQNKGITTVGELGASLAQVTPTAAAFGVSFEQVGAALAGMTAQGTPTAQATTQLNSLIAELGKEGTTAANNLAKAAEGTELAGMSFNEMMESGADLNEILGLMQGLADKNEVSMVDMFSSIEAGKAAMSITNSDWTGNMEAMATEADVVGEAFGTMSDTVSFKMDQMKTTLQNMGIEAFSSMADTLQGALEGLSGIFQEIKPHLETVGEAFLKIFDAVGNVIGTALGLDESFSTTDAVSGFLSTTLDGVAGAMEWIAEKMELATPLVSGIKEVFDEISPSLEALWETIENAFGSIVEYITNAVNSVKEFSGEISLTEEASNVLTSVLDGIGAAIQFVIDHLDVIMPILAGVVAGFLAFQTITTVTTLLTTAVSGLGAAFMFLTSPIGIVVAAIAAAVAIGIVIYKNWDKIKEKAAELGEWITEKWNAMKEAVVGTWNNIKETVSGVVDGIKNAVQEKFDAVKNAVSTVSNGIKDVTTNTLNSMKSAYQNAGGGIKGVISAWMTGVKSLFSNGFNFINNLTGGKLTGIKDKFVSIFETVKNTVSNAINTIKGIFSGAKLELPHFKLPHFKISGGEIPWGIGGQGKKPTIDVEWYAKGGVFDVPSIIGVGEAGKEAVIPLQGNNMRPFARAIAEEMAGHGGTNNFYITVDGAENPEEFADRLVRQIQLRARMA